MSDGDYEAIHTAVVHHSLPKELDRAHPHWRLTSLLKDADGMDRVRLGDLEPRYLRHTQSLEMVAFAEARSFFLHREEGRMVFTLVGKKGQALTEDERRLVSLHYFDGYNYDQISSLLGVTRSQVSGCGGGGMRDSGEPLMRSRKGEPWPLPFNPPVPCPCMNGTRLRLARQTNPRTQRHVGMATLATRHRGEWC